jgi:hypothetical protein
MFNSAQRKQLNDLDEQILALTIKYTDMEYGYFDAAKQAEWERLAHQAIDLRVRREKLRKQFEEGNSAQTSNVALEAGSAA